MGTQISKIAAQHQMKVVVVRLQKTAGWWAIDPAEGTGQIDHATSGTPGGLANEVRPDPTGEKRYNGDGPADVMGQAISDINQAYINAWDRSATPEEIQAVFRFCWNPIRKGLTKLGAATKKVAGLAQQKVWWHGTQKKGISRLEPRVGFLFLAPTPEVAWDYAARGREPTLWRVEVSPSRIADLRDPSDPLTRKLFDEWNRKEETLSKQSWVAKYSAWNGWASLEFGPLWVLDFLKKIADGVLLGDQSLYSHISHVSLALFTTKPVRSAQEVDEKVVLAKQAAKDKIPGGLADKKKPSDFDAKALAKGLKVEVEHTTDKDIAREIAMDHLTEDPKYYDKLETIEKHGALTAAWDALENPGHCKVAKGVWYHGTYKSFDKFEVQKHQRTFGTGASDTPLFFTPDEHFARIQVPGRGGTIYKVRLTWRSLFDSDNLVRSDRFWPPERDALTPEGQVLYDDLENGKIFSGGPVSDDDWYDVFGDSQGLFANILRHDYDVIETTEFKRWLKKRGYDAALVTGDGPINVFVFSPKQVEVLDSYPVHGKKAQAETPQVSKRAGTTGDGHGVGLFFRLPEELASTFPSLGSDDDSPPHVTFLYVGAITPEQQAEFLEITRGVFSSWGRPTAAHHTGLKYFQHPEKDRSVAIQGVRFGQDMAGLRWRLRDALMDAGFDVQDSFPLIYKPHTTLAYQEGMDTKFQGPVPGGRWPVTEAEVWGLPQVHTIPLGGLNRTAARPIRLPTREIKALAKKLTQRLRSWGLPKPGRVVAQEFFPLTNVRGDEVVVEVLLTGSPRRHPDPFNNELLHGGFLEPRPGKDPRMRVFVNPYVRSFEKTPARIVEAELYRLLAHELTHGADIWSGKGSAGNLSDSMDDFKKNHHNHPAEVRALMRDVVTDVEDTVSSYMEVGMDFNMAVREALLDSKWPDIEPYLTPKNKKIILKGVHTHLRDVEKRTKQAKVIGPQLFLLPSGVKPDPRVLKKTHKLKNRNINKPSGGFWTSLARGTTSDWLDWCGDEFRHGEQAWILDVLPGADVYQIRNQKDVDYLLENFPFKNTMGETMIDWESLGELVDGIHVTRQAERLPALYGWDVESTVWTNPKLRVRQLIDVQQRCRIPEKPMVYPKLDWEIGKEVRPGVRKRRKPWLRAGSLELDDEAWDKFAAGGGIRRLVMFDFDGTLFHGAEFTPEWWADPAPFSWGSDPVSMGPPCVPKRPGSAYWNAKALKGLREADKDPDTTTLLITGRIKTHRPRIRELLKQQGISPNVLYFNPGMSAVTFKKNLLAQIISGLPDLESVVIWENENLKAYTSYVEQVGAHLGKDLWVKGHLIRDQHVPYQCDADDLRGSYAVLGSDAGWDALDDQGKEALDRTAERYGPNTPLMDHDKVKVKYRVKSNSDGIQVAVYYGRTKIGAMNAFVKRYPEQDSPCSSDVWKLLDKYPQVEEDTGRPRWVTSDGVEHTNTRALQVYKAFITDDTKHGLGIGRAMYLAIMTEWYKKVGPFLFMPMKCGGSSGTSMMALRVWKSLGRDYPSSGTVIAVLRAPTLPSQMKMAAKFKNKKQVDKADGSGKTTIYEYSDGQIGHRNREKAKRIEGLRKGIGKLRSQVAKDLTSKDESTRLTALAIALIDETFERVGNPGSAKEGHYGVTGWLSKHVKVSGSKATLNYVGKSGVKQTKTVSNAKVVTALKAAIKAGGDAVCDGDDCTVTSGEVNAYLKPFKVTAKDLRGFHANQEVQSRLKAVRGKGGKLPTDEKEKAAKLKDEFKKALEEAAAAVGHEASTLKSQYLVPGLEEAYLKDGTVSDKLDKQGSSTPVMISAVRSGFGKAVNEWAGWKSQLSSTLYIDLPSLADTTVKRAFQQWLWDDLIHGPFGDWYDTYGAMTSHKSGKWHPTAALVVDLRTQISQDKVSTKEIFSTMDEYFNLAAADLRATAPDHINYKGLLVKNPHGFTDNEIEKVLDAISYVVALFKKRGVLDLFYQSVKSITLSIGTFAEVMRGVAGGYLPSKKEIDIVASALRQGGAGRMLKDWVHEILLHEIGHHLHLSILPGDAKAFWDKPWQDARENISWVKGIEQKVSAAEASQFWNLLVQYKGKLPSIKKKLPREDLARFHMLLAANGLVGEKSLSWLKRDPDWTPYQWDGAPGKAFAALLANPDTPVKGRWHDYTSEHVENVKNRILKGIGESYRTKGVLVNYMKKPFTKAIKKLDVPTDYAGTSGAEDFAESFVAFLDAPQKLSDTAMYRMKRTLSLAGLFGKPIMRVALEDEWDQLGGAPKTGRFENLKPTDKVTVYHGTGLAQVSDLINGFDANKHRERNTSGLIHQGLFVAPTVAGTGQFGGGHLVLELVVRAKNLHGTDFDGNIGRRDEGTDWLQEKYPDSFRPYLTNTLQLSQGEPQALLRGLVSPAQIKRILYQNKWQSRKEFLALVGPASDIRDVGWDLSKANYSLDEFFKALASSRGKVTKAKAMRLVERNGLKGLKAVADLMERVGFGPTAIKSFFRKFKQYTEASNSVATAGEWGQLETYIARIKTRNSALYRPIMRVALEDEWDHLGGAPQPFNPLEHVIQTLQWKQAGNALRPTNALSDYWSRAPYWAVGNVRDGVYGDLRTGTKSKAEKEDQETERLVRPEPKKKPPRKDLRRERMKVDDDDIEDMGADGQKDMSLNYKKVAAEEPHKSGDVWQSEAGNWVGMNPEGHAQSFTPDGKGQEKAKAWAKGEKPSGDDDEKGEKGKGEEEDKGEGEGEDGADKEDTPDPYADLFKDDPEMLAVMEELALADALLNARKKEPAEGPEDPDEVLRELAKEIGNPALAEEIIQEMQDQEQESGEGAGELTRPLSIDEGLELLNADPGKYGLGRPLKEDEYQKWTEEAGLSDDGEPLTLGGMIDMLGEEVGQKREFLPFSAEAEKVLKDRKEQEAKSFVEGERDKVKAEAVAEKIKELADLVKAKEDKHAQKQMKKVRENLDSFLDGAGGKYMEVQDNFQAAMDEMSTSEQLDFSNSFQARMMELSVPPVDGFDKDALQGAIKAIANPLGEGGSGPVQKGEALAAAVHAKTVLANPRWAGGREIKPGQEATEGELEKRAADAYAQYAQFSPELRKEAISQLSVELNKTPLDAPEREELERVADALALSAAANGESLEIETVTHREDASGNALYDKAAIAKAEKALEAATEKLEKEEAKEEPDLDAVDKLSQLRDEAEDSLGKAQDTPLTETIKSQLRPPASAEFSKVAKMAQEHGSAVYLLQGAGKPFSPEARAGVQEAMEGIFMNPEDPEGSLDRLGEFYADKDSSWGDGWGKVVDNIKDIRKRAQGNPHDPDVKAAKEQLADAQWAQEVLIRWGVSSMAAGDALQAGHRLSPAEHKKMKRAVGQLKADAINKALEDMISCMDKSQTETDVAACGDDGEMEILQAEYEAAVEYLGELDATKPAVAQIQRIIETGDLSEKGIPYVRQGEKPGDRETDKPAAPPRHEPGDVWETKENKQWSAKNKKGLIQTFPSDEEGARDQAEAWSKQGSQRGYTFEVWPDLTASLHTLVRERFSNGS